jgi:hypothetical protein
MAALETRALGLLGTRAAGKRARGWDRCRAGSSAGSRDKSRAGSRSGRLLFSGLLSGGFVLAGSAAWGGDGVLLLVIVASGGRSARAGRDNLGSRTVSEVGLVSAPDAEVDLRVVDFVDTGDLHSVGGKRSAATRNADLGTGIVELGLTIVGTVETDVFRTDEVLAIGDVGGNLEGDSVLIPGAPNHTVRSK